MVSIDVHTDLIPEVTQLGTDLHVVLAKLQIIVVIRVLSKTEDAFDSLTDFDVLVYAFLPVDDLLVYAADSCDKTLHDFLHVVHSREGLFNFEHSHF